ncbi:hypothetical protein CYMTET_18056 [Cymbomonas tetramitiformis]|uniref:glucan endo-1,3-beta-D-glucosidase n=1 Tax=Cymbomonas tetramitiformis TaxID=36881 RepID=A0AAE0G9G1_9CHLO|nr:hypothetical protein CYMTET_18056 [Cymbomonas tetramitiformis]
MKSILAAYVNMHNGITVDWNKNNFTGFCFSYTLSQKDSNYDLANETLNRQKSARYDTNTGDIVDYQFVNVNYPNQLPDMCVRFDAGVRIAKMHDTAAGDSDLHSSVTFTNDAVLRLTRGSPILTLELPPTVTAMITPLFYDLTLAPPSDYTANRGNDASAACDLIDNEQEPYASDVIMWSDANGSYYRGDQTTFARYGYLVHHFNSAHSIHCSTTAETYTAGEAIDGKHYSCFTNPLDPKICDGVTRRLSPTQGFVRGGHDARLYFTNASVWRMLAVETPVPSPNTTVHALTHAQKYVICTAFAKDKNFRPISTNIYMNAKETHRMARVLHTAEALGCGSDVERQQLADALRMLLLRFLDGSYPYYYENGGSSNDACAHYDKCLQYCSHGCGFQGGLRYDDTAWGGIIMDGNYGQEGNNGRNDWRDNKNHTFEEVVNNDIAGMYGHKHYSDHHYHFGYYVAAAAVYAYGHPDFLASLMIGPSCLAPNVACVTVKDKLLTVVKEIANYDVHDAYFPQARHKDMYDRASWAGALNSDDTKLRNQEATVEGHVGYYGVELLGQLLQDEPLQLWAPTYPSALIKKWRNYVHAFHALTLQDVDVHLQSFQNDSTDDANLDNGMSRVDTLLWFYTIANGLN